MTVEQLRVKLEGVNSTRSNRLQNAIFILEHPELIFKLLEIALSGSDKLSDKASWICEFACNRNLTILFPHLDYFTEHLDVPNSDSSIRPLAKICELLVTAFYGPNTDEIKNVLGKKHKKAITSFCFDILIGKHKVAPQAYAMSTLEKLGTEFKWIHPELKIIIERDYTSQSKGYQARARKILSKV